MAPGTETRRSGTAAPKRGAQGIYPAQTPLNQRRAPALDMRTIERPARAGQHKEERRSRPHHIREAPVYRPSEEEFKDPYRYIRHIRPEAEKYGICKIIPPDSWRPTFALDTERFFFKTRRQELNSVEGGCRTKVQYLEQLAKFHDHNGGSSSRFPAIDRKPLDLYKLKQLVAAKGGWAEVCRLKGWADIGQDLGYAHKITSSVPSALKHAYQKWVLPYEEFVRAAKANGHASPSNNVAFLSASPSPTKSPGDAKATKRPLPGDADEASQDAKRLKGISCSVCQIENNSPQMSCNGCDQVYHQDCIELPARRTSEWYCPACLVGTGDFGFEEGGVYSLRQFQEKANSFLCSFFNKSTTDPSRVKAPTISPEKVEREFWRLVGSPDEEIVVEYGADIHSITHGSGFHTIEQSPDDPYAYDFWNLNIMPFHPDSLFKHIKADISGMTIPWLYVGMCFSTFCWHNEDHYAYSANYQHFGATKTWYGIPGADAERFEAAMRKAVPELFELQPDLLFQLVTLLPPDQLAEAGVNVFALDQQAGQFVITFPQAYHAGFNHGFNFNEAVNFAPEDWEPFGDSGAQRLQQFSKQPCFSHDELLMNAASQEISISTARWLAAAMTRLQERELKQRELFNIQKPQFVPVIEAMEHEVEHQCVHCKAYAYLSNCKCRRSGEIMCLLHTDNCCDDHVLRYRTSSEDLVDLVRKIVDRARLPTSWEEKLDSTLNDTKTPSLKILRALVHEGERIDWPLDALADLKDFVAKCTDWVERAQSHLSRKQQNRRKNDRVWRKNKDPALDEEKEKEARSLLNFHRLLHEAETLSFDCPELDALKERAVAITEFQKNARSLIAHGAAADQINEVLESARGFNLDIPEMEQLENFSSYRTWLKQVEEFQQSITDHSYSFEQVAALITSGTAAGALESDESLSYLRHLLSTGQAWEARARELLAMDVLNHPQLEALYQQAKGLPVHQSTVEAVDSVLSKQRDAHLRVVRLFQGSQDLNRRNRPFYKQARETLDSLLELNLRPTGTVELEGVTKRHETWMRRGKRLFGKANAPLHILQSHMVYVAEHNSACFDTTDKPRMPVEPASRDHTPVEGAETVGLKSEKNVFCMCRRAEAGTMLECELCLEWYHSRCLKVARGKVKERDKYNCPICDWRDKIPRDAARPKLEELLVWQREIPSLPFQAEEETVLAEIINQAQHFRDFLRPHINPMMTNPDEVTTQRFYLRKIEGAEVLLAFETNFFRQEVHKWAPVTQEPPPVLEESKSTRKPRPTKQQKIMQQYGVEKVDDLPEEIRRKALARSRKSQGDPPSPAPIPPPEPQAAPPRPVQDHPPPASFSAGPEPGYPAPEPKHSPVEQVGPSPYFTQTSDLNPQLAYDAPPTYPISEPSLEDEAPQFASGTSSCYGAARTYGQDGSRSPRMDDNADVFSQFLAPYGTQEDDREIT